MNSTTIQMTNALLWAAAMIGSSVILKGTGYSTDMLNLLLTLNTLSILLVQGGHKSIKSEWKCIQSLFSRK